MRINQSVCYPLFKALDMSLDQLFGILADIGHTAVELWAREDDFEEVVRLAKTHAPAVASMEGMRP